MVLHSLTVYRSYGPSDLSQANELTLGYSIYFEPGFGAHSSTHHLTNRILILTPRMIFVLDFAKGGKLPGLCTSHHVFKPNNIKY